MAGFKNLNFDFYDNTEGPTGRYFRDPVFVPQPRLFPKYGFVVLKSNFVKEFGSNLQAEHERNEGRWRMPGTLETRTQWIQTTAMPSKSKDCLSLSIKVPKDTKSLATFKSFLCFLHGVGETACLVGKTIAQGPIHWLHSSKRWLRQNRFSTYRNDS